MCLEEIQTCTVFEKQRSSIHETVGKQYVDPISTETLRCAARGHFAIP